MILLLGRPGSAPFLVKAMTTFKFLWNGLKVNNGKLQKAHYYKGGYAPEAGFPDGTITIYARTYTGFTREVWETFDVKNDTDTMTDYFEKDCIRVKPDHPLYQAVLAGCEACERHYQKMQARREERYAQRRQTAMA